MSEEPPHLCDGMVRALADLDIPLAITISSASTEFPYRMAALRSCLSSSAHSAGLSCLTHFAMNGSIAWIS